MRPYTLTPDLTGEGLHIGIVCARFNETVTYKELDACLSQLNELGVHERNIMVVTVPGALEIGLALHEMAITYEFDALIALGAVIRGESYHFEIVSNESARAVTKVSLETAVPIANGILTVDTDEQAIVRADEKGKDCALCAVEMANLLLDLQPEEGDDADEGLEIDDEDDSESGSERH